MKRIDTPCPCGHPLPYARCCQPLHKGIPAADAEALMRSRYCAYVLRLEDYLQNTWHASTRPTGPLFDSETQPKWIGLEVRSFKPTGENTAEVEFLARCRIGGRAQRMHECSRFVREDGRWFYLDGDQFD